MSKNFNNVLNFAANRVANIRENHASEVDKIRANNRLSDLAKEDDIQNLIEATRGEIAVLREAYEGLKAGTLADLEREARGYQDMAPAAVTARREALTLVRSVLANHSTSSGAKAELAQMYDDARFNGDSYLMHSIGHATRGASGFGAIYETYSADFPDYAKAAGAVAEYTRAANSSQTRLDESRLFSPSGVTDTGNLDG